MERLINTPVTNDVPIELAAPEDLQGKLAEIGKVQLRGFFGLNDATPAEAKMLDELTMIFSGKQDADLLWEVRNIESRIGTPPIGMSRIQHVYNYLVIQNQITQLELMRNAYLN